MNLTIVQPLFNNFDNQTSDYSADANHKKDTHKNRKHVILFVGSVYLKSVLWPVVKQTFLFYQDLKYLSTKWWFNIFIICFPCPQTWRAGGVRQVRLWRHPSPRQRERARHARVRVRHRPEVGRTLLRALRRRRQWCAESLEVPALL